LKLIITSPLPVRRKIRVYSALLSAITIDHGGSESLGPDLLVSFHDHENHYNSVRNRKAPPKKVATNYFTQEQEPELDPENDTGEGNRVDPQEVLPEQTTEIYHYNEPALEGKMQGLSISENNPVHKSAPCPCGSGQKYRKCCKKQKQSLGRQNLKSKQSGREKLEKMDAFCDNAPPRRQFQLVDL